MDSSSGVKSVDPDQLASPAKSLTRVFSSHINQVWMYMSRNGQTKFETYICKPPSHSDEDHEVRTMSCKIL